MAANVLVSTKNMSREDWLAARRLGIGSSDAPAVAGVSKWKSPMAVYLEKTGEAPPDEPGEAAYWGTVLEDTVAREFANRTGMQVRRANAILQHPEHPFMLANLDRVVKHPEHGKCILECKTAGEWFLDDWDSELIPEAYQVQVQHQLAITGLPFAYIAVLIGGNKFRIKEVPRDEGIIEHLIRIESEFWHLVETRTPPEIGGASAGTLLHKLYPEADKGSRVELPDVAADLIRSHRQWAEAEKDAAAHKEAAANRIKALLGASEAGLLAGEPVVRWSTVHTERLDTATLKVARPDIYQEFLKPSVFRRFEIAKGR